MRRALVPTLLALSLAGCVNSAPPAAAAADQPAAFTCRPPALVELSKKLGRNLCVQDDILANLSATGPEIMAALNSSFLSHPFLKDFQNELAGGPGAITCRAGGRSLTCAHNSYWIAMDHPTEPYWKGMPPDPNPSLYGWLQP